VPISRRRHRYSLLGIWFLQPHPAPHSPGWTRRRPTPGRCGFRPAL